MFRHRGCWGGLLAPGGCQLEPAGGPAGGDATGGHLSHTYTASAPSGSVSGGYEEKGLTQGDIHRLILPS